MFDSSRRFNPCKFNLMYLSKPLVVKSCGYRYLLASQQRGSIGEVNIGILCVFYSLWVHRPWTVSVLFKVGLLSFVNHVEWPSQTHENVHTHKHVYTMHVPCAKRVPAFFFFGPGSFHLPQCPLCSFTLQIIEFPAFKGRNCVLRSSFYPRIHKHV